MYEKTFIGLYGIGHGRILFSGFQKKKINKLEKWDIKIDDKDWADQQVQTDFETMFKKDRKQRRRKTWGIILSSLSAVTITGGIIAAKVNERNNRQDDNLGDNPIGGLAATALIVTGIVEGGVSIPCFISSRTKRRERDRLIEKYNPDGDFR